MKLTILVCLLIGVTQIEAQQTSIFDGTAPAGAAPGSPAGTSSLSGFDRHNPFSGSLSPAMTLYHVGGRGEAGFDLVWNFQQTWVAAKRFGGTNFFIPIDPYPSNNIAGPSSAAGPLGAGAVFSRTGSNFISCAGGGSAVGSTLAKIVFEAPDGTQVELVDQNTNGTPYTIPNACSQTPLNVNAGRGTTFQSTDGGATKFVSDSAVLDNTSPGFGEADAKVNGILRFSSGVSYRIDNSVVSWITDRNGNKITFNYGSAIVPVTWYLFVAVPTQITDSVGRVITLNYNDSSCSGCTSISYPGTGGAARVIRIVQAHLSNNLLRDSGASVKTLDQLFPNTNQNTSSNFDPILASSIQLPDGSQYTFKYNTYGELARVNLPAGGAVEYDLGDGYNGSGDGFQGSTTDNNPVMIYRRLQERREYASGGSTLTARTHFTVSYPASSTAETVASFDPWGTLLAQTVHTMNGTPTDALSLTGTGCNNWNEGLEVQTDYGAPNPLRTVNNTYAQQSGCMSNPQLVSQSTKLVDQSKVSQVTFAYDQFNNVSDKAEYDWGSGVPGALLRDTKTVYLYQSNGAYATASVNLVRAPYYSTVFDASNAKVAQSVWHYDGTGVQAESGITGHDDANYGTGFNLRANPTQVSAWVSTSNTFVNSLMAYDVAGNVLSVQDPSGNTTTMSYADSYADAQNRNSYAHPTSVTQVVNSGLSLVTAAQYDYSTGQTTTSTDVNHVSTTYAYNDPLDRLTTATSGVAASGGLNAQTSYQYPNPTSVIVQQDQNASGDGLLKSQTLYDGLGRAVETDTFESASQYIATRTLYDALGRTQWVTNPARSGDAVNTTTYTYDSLGRVTQTQTPDGAVAATVYAGNTVTVADQAGNKKQYTYNALGWLTNVLEDPSGLKIATAYLYDTLGNLKSVTQGSCPGQCKQRGFSYDSLSRLVSATNPESGTTTYSYNPNATLAARTDANSKTTSYLYDGINRLTQKSYSDGTPTVNYFYDSSGSPNSLGRLSQVSNANGSTLYTGYDVLGRPTASTQVSQGHNYNFAYSHNLAGALLAETYPTGRTLWNGYDGAGRLAYLRGSNWVGVWTNYMIVAGYAAHGAPTSYVYGNNLWRNVTYNNRLQATSAIDQVNNNAGQQLLNLAWNWGTTNNNGNLQGITQNNGGPGYPQFLTFNQSFIYDSLNRLSTVSDSGGWSQAYQYDQWGNRWLDMGHTNGTPVNGTTPTTNNFDGNNRINGGAYDSAGNQTVVNGNTLVFDAENRMVSVTAPGNAGGGTETIQYDGSDHRISKTVGGNTTAYVYDVFGQLTVEYSTVPQPTPCATCYVSADQLGTPRLVTDGNANLVARHDYLPFGEEIGANTAGRSAQWGPANDNVNAKFTGQERDSETGLDYFNARYMGTSLGRFVSPDPANAGADLTNPQTWNGYSYVGNSPLAMTDPSGKSFLSFLGNFFSAILSDLFGAGGSPFDLGHPPFGIGNAGVGGEPWSEQSPVNAIPISNAGSLIIQNFQTAQVSADVTQSQNAVDAAQFLRMWFSGKGPRTITYGPNDGATKDMMRSSNVQQARQAYIDQGCPSTFSLAQGHLAAYGESAKNFAKLSPNYTQLQVGGYGGSNSSITTSSGTTNYTITNVAGTSSFFGESTWGPRLPGFLKLRPDSWDDPLGPSGPGHNVTQTFKWSEPNPCR